MFDYLASHDREGPMAMMQSERTIVEFTRRRGFRVEKLGSDKYRLISKKLSAVMYLFDGVPLKAIVSHFEGAPARNSNNRSSRASRVRARRR